MLLIAITIVLLLVCFIGLFWRLASRFDAQQCTAEWLDSFSVKSYAPMERLLEKGAEVEYSDPHIPSLPSMRRYPHLKRDSRPLSSEYLGSRDCVLIVTDHSSFDWPWIVEHSRLVVDTRNATRGLVATAGRIVRA